MITTGIKSKNNVLLEMDRGQNYAVILVYFTCNEAVSKYLNSKNYKFSVAPEMIDLETPKHFVPWRAQKYFEFTIENYKGYIVNELLEHCEFPPV